MILDRFGREYGRSRAGGRPDLSFLGLGAEKAIQKIVKDHSSFLQDLRTYAEREENWIDVASLPPYDSTEFDSIMNPYTRWIKYKSGSILISFAIENYTNDNRLGVRRAFTLISYGMLISKRVAWVFANPFFVPKEKMQFQYDRDKGIWIFVAEYKRPSIEIGSLDACGN